MIRRKHRNHSARNPYRPRRSANGNLCELIENARVGVDDAVRTLLSELEPFLRQRALRLTANCKLSPDWRHQSASDLLQETRLRIWNGIANFRGAAEDDDMESCLRRWVTVIMQRAFLDMIDENRQLRSSPLALNGAAFGTPSGLVGSCVMEELPSTDPSPSRNLMTGERAVRVHEAMERLANVEDRRVVEEYFFRGRSLRQIAADLGMEYTKLRRQFHQVLSTLGSDLGDV